MKIETNHPNRDLLFPHPVAGFQIEVLDGEAVLFHATKLTLVHLNPSAALVYRLSDGQRSVGEIVSLLTDAYPESAAGIPGDVQKALDWLVAAGTLVLAPAGIDGPAGT